MLVLSRNKQTGEGTFFLTNLKLMQPDQIVPHMVELEFLNGWNDLFAVMPFVKDAEGEDEYGVVGIQLLHPVVAALININDEVAESSSGE